MRLNIEKLDTFLKYIWSINDLILIFLSECYIIILHNLTTQWKISCQHSSTWILKKGWKLFIGASIPPEIRGKVHSKLFSNNHEHVDINFTKIHFISLIKNAQSFINKRKRVCILLANSSQGGHFTSKEGTAPTCTIASEISLNYIKCNLGIYSSCNSCLMINTLINLTKLLLT